MHSLSAHQAGSIKLFHHTFKFSINNVHWSVLTSYLILSASCSVFSLISMMTCDTGFSIKFSATTWKHIVQSFHRCWRHQQVSQLGWILKLLSDLVSVPITLPGHLFTVTGALLRLPCACGTWRDSLVAQSTLWNTMNQLQHRLYN